MKIGVVILVAVLALFVLCCFAGIVAEAVLEVESDVESDSEGMEEPYW